MISRKSMCRYLSICSRQEKLYEGKKIKKMKNATREYITNKTSRYPQLVQAPPLSWAWLRVGGGVLEQDAGASWGMQLRASEWLQTGEQLPVTCCPYTGQDALYTINTDTVPYPVHYTPAAVMLSQPSTLLHIHIHSHCTALAAIRSSRKTLGNYLLQFLTLHML